MSPIDATPDSTSGETVIDRGSSKQSFAGRKVQHAIFGVGVVETEEGSGPEARLSIAFPGVGRKKILARFVQVVG